MAKSPCIFILDGKTYTYDTFREYLANGGIEKHLPEYKFPKGTKGKTITTEAQAIYQNKKTAPSNIKDRFGLSKTSDNSILSAVPKELHSTLPDGTKVYVVDGKYVRDNIHSDFAQGGNEMAYPEYVPKGEVWIEKGLEAEFGHIIKHEVGERNLMKKGDDYLTAHEKVKAIEDSERGKNTSPKTEVEPQTLSQNAEAVYRNEGQIPEGRNVQEVRTVESGSDLQQPTPEKPGGEIEQIKADIERSKSQPVEGLLDRVESISDPVERAQYKDALSKANMERAKTQVDKIKEVEQKPEKTPEDEQLVENSIVPIKGSLKKRIQNGFNRYFRPRGNMPVEARSLTNESQAGVTAERVSIDKSVKSLQNISKKELGVKKGLKTVVPEADLKLINDSVNGDTTAFATLKAKAPETAIRVIDLMNERTKYQKVLQKFVGENMAEIIMDSEGSYMTRSYRLFHSPKQWKKFLEGAEGDTLKSNAEIAIRNLYSNKGISLSDAEVEGIINKIIDAPNQKMNRGASGSIGSLDLSSLIRRKEIPVEIRELMGEVKNPYLNLYVTLTKLANMAKSMEYINDLAKAGSGKWLYDTPTGEHYVPLYGKNSLQAKIMGKEVYTTPEIAQAFNDMSPEKVTGVASKVLTVVNSIPKFMMTLGSTPGIARNFISSMMINAANGRLIPGAMAKGAKMMVESMKSESAFKDTVKMLYQKGILGESVKAGDIKAYAKDFIDGSTSWDRFYDGAIKKMAKGGMDLLRTSWSIGDDINRIIGFYGELSKLKSAYGNKKPLAELESMAADKLIATTPTYSRTPKIVSEIKKIPLIGPFPSWTAEIMRTSGNTLALALKELKTPNERAIGMSRLVSFVGVTALPYGIKAVSEYINGTNDEDEDRYRLILPDYAKYSQIIPMSADGKNLDYINMSFIDPYSMWKEIASAAVRSGDVKKGIIEGIDAWAKPFYSSELGAQLLINMYANKDSSTGEPIYNENADPGDMAIDVLNYVWEKGLKPGTWKAAEKINKEGRKPGREIANTFFGVRTQSIDVEKSLASLAKDYASAIRDAKKPYNRYRYNPKSTSEERASGLEESNRIYKNLFDEFHKKTMACNYYLGDSEITRSILKDAGLSKKEIERIMLNEFEGYKDQPIYDEGGEKIPEKKSGDGLPGIGGGMSGGLPGL